jgi:hypothetical protein
MHGCVGAHGRRISSSEGWRRDRSRNSRQWDARCPRHRARCRRIALRNYLRSGRSTSRSPYENLRSAASPETDLHRTWALCAGAADRRFLAKSVVEPVDRRTAGEPSSIRAQRSLAARICSGRGSRRGSARVVDHPPRSRRTALHPLPNAGAARRRGHDMAVLGDEGLVAR